MKFRHSFSRMLCLRPARVGGQLISVMVVGSMCAVNVHAQRLRIAAANTTSGNFQSYDPGEGTRIFQGTKPDIVLVQEFNYQSNSAADIRAFVTTAFGAGFVYYREAGAQIPNGVISRYPILSSGEWDDTAVANRDFAWARIDIPGPVNLWAISVHFLTSNATTRSSQARALRQLVQQNVPAGDFVVIAGDFNSDSRSEGLYTDLAAIVDTDGPYPADQSGIQGTNASRLKPYDGVYVSPSLESLATAAVFGSVSFPNGAVIDTRAFSPLQEIAPALSGDSGATNMQHMQVVRDFLLPIPADPPEIPVLSSQFTLTGSPRLALTFRSTIGAQYQIQVSENLDQGQWRTLQTVTATSTSTAVTIARQAISPTPPIQVLDPPIGSLPRRFYRIAR